MVQRTPGEPPLEPRESAAKIAAARLLGRESELRDGRPYAATPSLDPIDLRRERPHPGSPELDLGPRAV